MGCQVLCNSVDVSLVRCPQLLFCSVGVRCLKLVCNSEDVSLVRCATLSFCGVGMRCLKLLCNSEDVSLVRCATMSFCGVVVADVPDAPQTVIIKERSPNQLVLEVEPPTDNGGMEVLGYRIEYEDQVQDFQKGVLKLIILFKCSNIIYSFAKMVK